MEGISLRDYLAAHAPAEPQWWFRPVLSAEWSKRPQIPNGLTVEARRTLESWANDPSWDCDGDVEREPAALQFVADMRAHWKHNDALREEEKRERLIQWPYAWADAMLVARGGR